jgi:hypothetical protein
MSNTNVIYHTVRHSSGQWQNYFGLVESEVSGGPPGFAAVGCAGTGDALQVVGVGTDAQLYHTSRKADGTWQNYFGAIASEVSGGPGEFVEVACGGVGGDMHVMATGFDQKLYHTIRDASGDWQSTFGLIESQVTGGPRAFETVSCAGVGGSELQVAAAAGSIYHTIRDASGHWQNPFGVVESEVSGGPTQGFRAAGCAGAGDILEVVGVGSDGELYHTIRNSDGSWQNFFGLIESQVTGGPLQFTAVGCTGVGSDLHVVGGAFLGGFL